MILKFLKRCFLACMLVAMFVFGTVAVCWVLACSPPDFYATAIAEPVDEADIKAAVKELEQTVSSMGMFIKLKGSDFEKLQALPDEAFANLADNKKGPARRLPSALKMLRRSPDVTQDTFAVTLTERQVNALLSEEFGRENGKLRRPHVSLQGDMIRFAVAVITPAAEVVLSCEFELAKTNPTDLTFDLHAARVGRLRLPIMAALKLYMQTNPVLPRGIELNVDSERPTLSIDVASADGDLLLDDVHVRDGKLRLLFRRAIDEVAMAK